MDGVSTMWVMSSHNIKLDVIARLRTYKVMHWTTFHVVWSVCCKSWDCWIRNQTLWPLKRLGCEAHFGSLCFSEHLYRNSTQCCHFQKDLLRMCPSSLRIHQKQRTRADGERFLLFLMRPALGTGVMAAVGRVLREPVVGVHVAVNRCAHYGQVWILYRHKPSPGSRHTDILLLLESF